ncbi:hypothetical protein Misp01_26730 [Microtetraspora sp. NBRC 13810]|uniref:hypothetical protein n=1 Tax=Microtetraspora sp. NBRC 13810 TaxID=3030990 RepID=UPI0024A44B36|nr:hypothetical protein [Microtetraspora sp. NBRC 13810]GLW07543.1 hypothetical protein Misp01_26730 [Microtetraspora sp. NBRC 13810]
MSEMDVRGDDLVERANDDDVAPGEIGIETAEADRAEQHRTLREGNDTWRYREIPFDVDPADAADQGRTIDLDEDDYR